jgi:hypothetical protein
MTITVFNPDAHVESGSVDGFVSRDTSGCTWADMRAGAGTSNNSCASTFLAYFIAGACPGNACKYSGLYRGFQLYETCTICCSDNICSATFDFVVTQVTTALAGAVELSFVTTTPACVSTLANGDFGNMGTTEQTATLPLACITANSCTFNSIALNATGLGNISKSGPSKFGTRAKVDLADCPTPCYGADQSSRVRIASAEETLDGDKKPRLIVTHTPTFIPKVIIIS